MITFFIDSLVKYYPQVGVYALIGAALIFFTWKVSVFCVKTNALHEEFPSLKTLIGEIRSALVTLNQVLVEKNVINKSVFSQSNSPRQMNAVGVKLYNESGAKSAFEGMRDDLMKDLEAKKLDSFLELEREALNVVLAKMNDIRFKAIQNYAFEHSSFDNNPLTYTDILHVISLNLRDAYIAKHPENTLG